MPVVLFHLEICRTSPMNTSSEIIKELERRVATRRSEGKYPIGLEQQLEADFEAILDVVHRGNDSVAELEALLEDSREIERRLRRVVSPQSHFPFVSSVRRIVNRVTGRRARQLTALTIELMHIQVQTLEVVGEQLRQQRDTDSRVLNQVAVAMRDRLMMIDVLAEAIMNIESQFRSGHSTK